MLKRFGKGKQPCLTPEHRSEPVSYTASKVDSTGGFVVGVLYNCVQIGSGCQISLLILCKALITASRRAYATYGGILSHITALQDWVVTSVGSWLDIQYLWVTFVYMVAQFCAVFCPPISNVLAVSVIVALKVFITVSTSVSST